MTTVTESLLLVVHAASTLVMTGVIWTVQLVHYPLLARVPAGSFEAYHSAHMRRMTWVVGPPMLAELLTGVLLVLAPQAGIPRWCAPAGLALIAAIWISTAGLQVPLHRRLERGFDAGTIDALVRSNWIRTVAWSLRALLVGWMVFERLGVFDAA